MNTRQPAAAQIMNRAVVTLSPETPVALAARMMLRHGCSGAPVVDDQQRVVGIFSERDCMDVLACCAWQEYPRETVADQMTTPPQTVTADTDITTIIKRFQKHTIRRLPVVENDGRLVGIISRRDVLRALHSMEEARIRRATAQNHLWEISPL